MFLRLVVLFTLLPLLELYLLIRIGQMIGALTTIAVVIITALLGAALTRQQGVTTLTRIRHTLAQGSMPASEIIDALLIFIAGVVLLTPGFITDSIGFLLLIPQSRRVVKKWLARKFRDWIDRGDVHVRFFG